MNYIKLYISYYYLNKCELEQNGCDRQNTDPIIKKGHENVSEFVYYYSCNTELFVQELGVTKRLYKIISDALDGDPAHPSFVSTSNLTEHLKSSQCLLKRIKVPYILAYKSRNFGQF